MSYVARVLNWGELTKVQKGEVISALRRLDAVVTTANAHQHINGVVIENDNGSPVVIAFVKLPKFSGWPFRNEIEFNERDIAASEDEGAE